MMRVNKSIIIFLVGMLLVSPAFGIDVVLVNDTLVVKDVQESLGGFHIILRHSDSVTVNSVEGVSPFYVDANIQPGYVNMAGIQASEILSGDVPVARVAYSGNGSFTIEIIDLVNSEAESLESGSDNEEDVSEAYSETISDGTVTVSQTEIPEVIPTEVSTSVSIPETTSLSDVNKSPQMTVEIEETSIMVVNTEELPVAEPTQVPLSIFTTISGFLLIMMGVMRKL